MGAGYGMMTGGMYGNQYEPRVQPGYYGVPGADAGRYVADAFMQQQQLNRQKQQYAHEQEMDPLETALYRAKLKQAGVSWPGEDDGESAQPSPGAGGNGAPAVSPSSVSPGMPARRIPLQLPAPYAGDASKAGGDVAPTVSMPGAFNPATNAHNTVLPPSQGASTPAASGVGAGPTSGAVPLGGGFSYTDPAIAAVQRYKAMGFDDASAQVMARDPEIARTMVTQRGEAPYKETPAQKLSDEELLTQMREKLRGETDLRVATAKGEVAPKGQMTRQQMQQWVDNNYSLGTDQAPALPPSRRIALAEQLYQSQFNAPRPNAAPPSRSLFQPPSRSLFQPHTKAAPAPNAPPAADAGSPPPTPGAPGTATPPATQQPTVTPTAPAGAQPKAPGAAPAPAAGPAGGRVLQGHDAITAAADSLANHPEVTDAQAHQLLRTKYGFDDSHVAQVLRLRRTRGRPAA